MTFVGAVIDGPLFGRNLACDFPTFTVPVPPKLSLTTEQQHVVLSLSVVTYRWWPSLGGWSCKP
jgi:hypothetical protein